MSDELQRADKGISGFLRSLMMTSTDRINAWNRGIIEYQPCSIDAFFTPDRGVYNAVISGGENKMRVKAMAAQAICAVKNNFPVVILHEGNYELEDKIRNVFEKVENLRMQGGINDIEEQQIKSKLMKGQSEIDKLDTYMASLKMEMGDLRYIPGNGQQPINIISALNDAEIICIDIASAMNKLLLNTLVFQLKLALSKGIRYTLIVDSISLNANEAFANYLKAPTDRICTLIAADDFYSMVGGDEKAFNALMGRCQIAVVMSHTSGNSATKWAEIFGQYDKYETSYSRAKGSSKRTPFSLFASPYQNNTVNINERREYVVKPEKIMRMGYGEAYVLTAARGELAHLILNDE